MELVGVLKQLIRMRLLVGVVLICATAVAAWTQYRLPSFERRSYEFGAAQTQLLVDSPASPLADVNQLIEPLASRAVVYARFMTSAPVREAIAREARIPVAQLDVSAPFNTGEARFIREAPAERRSNELLGEGRGYRMLANAEEGLPIVTISTQAPTAEEAERMANASVTALAQYVRGLQDTVPRSSRIEIRRLGEARGGTVNDGASRVVAVLTFLATFVLGCLGILALSGVVRLWTRARAVDPPLDIGWLGPTNGHTPSGHPMPGVEDEFPVRDPTEESPEPARR